MSEGNGDMSEAFSRISDVEDEAAKERRFVRAEFAYLREQLRHIGTTLDLILQTLHVDEKREESEHA